MGVVRAEVPIRQRVDGLTARIIALSHQTTEAYDPLQANEFFHNLPQWRRIGALDKICKAATELVDRASVLELESLTQNQAVAVHRDVAIAVTASVLPAEGEIPETEDIIPKAGEILNRLAHRTGFVPRLTDQLYVATPNTRRFTDDFSIITDAFGIQQKVFTEDIFKVAVGEGFSAVAAFVDLAVGISSALVSSPSFAQDVRKAALEFSAMTVGIASLAAEDKFPVEWFNQNLLPFLQKYKINGHNYYHSGSQMFHVLVANLMTGVATSGDFAYSQYQAKNLEYATFDQANAFAYIKQNIQINGNLVDRVLEGIPQDLIGVPSSRLEAIAAVAQLVLEMGKFRGPHTRKALLSVEMRPTHQGSAGDSEMLKNLLDWTQRQLQLLKPFLINKEG